MIVDRHHFELKEYILELPSDERKVLLCIALEGDGTTIPKLERVLGNGERTSEGKTWSRKVIGTIVQTLVHWELIKPGSTLVCEEDAKVPALFALAPLETELAARSSAYLLDRVATSSNSSYRRGYYSQTDFTHYGNLCRQLIAANDWDNFVDHFRRMTSRRMNWYDRQDAEAEMRQVKQILSVFDADFWCTREINFLGMVLVDVAEYDPNTTKFQLEQIENFFANGASQQFHRVDPVLVNYLGLRIIDRLFAKPELLYHFPSLQSFAYLIGGKRGSELTALPEPARIEDGSGDPIYPLIYLAQYGAGLINTGELTTQLLAIKSSPFIAAVQPLISYNSFLQGDNEWARQEILDILQNEYDDPLGTVFGILAAYWTGLPFPPGSLKDILPVVKEQPNGWLRGEILNALARTLPNHSDAPTWKNEAKTIAENFGYRYLIDLIVPKEPWEYVFTVIDALQGKPGTRDPAQNKPELRTIWIVDPERGLAYAKEQKLGRKGYSKGRKLKWSELIAPRDDKHFEEADHRAVIAMSNVRSGNRLTVGGYYHDDQIRVDIPHLLYQIVGHPRIYLGEKKRIPVELRRGTPELQITENEGGLLMRFEPPVDQGGFVWKRDTPTRYTIYHLDEEQGKIARAIGQGVTVPEAQRAAVESRIDGLRGKVSVQSTTDILNEDLPRIEGDVKPCVHLLPFKEGYKMGIYVKPLVEGTYYFKPGEGLPMSIGALEEGRVVMVRDLEAEVAATEAVIKRCPSVKNRKHVNYEWQLKDTQLALRVLLELRKLVEEEAITIEYPRGEKIKLIATNSSDDLAIQVGKNRDWFEVSGKLKVDENRVLDLELLLEHARDNESNFIQLGENEFVSLTDELRDRLRKMEGLLHQRGKSMQFPTLAAGHFAEVADGLDDLEFDVEWTESIERIKTAEKLRPQLPKHFNAELRDYQKEGFRWLMRLAAWGVGGCLADDMGLGKTVQALAMLTARADEGPALVIAPASVTRNWVSETNKFAPGLIPILLANSGQVGLINEVGNGDVLIVSFGLIPFIGKELEARNFASIVVDEAQAIKNSATKRAKVVSSLQGDFKVATTGTPIENHLGELWSLFRFLNPGLLGSQKAFNEKFNRPISVTGDKVKQEQLRQLVKPFILRRRKDQVLTELPPKTEIVLTVELSKEETALYEALRRQAIKEIAQADEQASRFTVLSQLTKLRQAACHPRLVRPTSKLPSAKLELVGETILELLENGHKALIFSQFVKHLKIVENWVKGQDIPYQYLDGSTPGKKREEAVNAFQSGDGKIFLISLKAGGTGLNLTSADFVLHLDPWWNPAAEDQASDRAHRIGQQRPVTVYRFVSEGTIEEQIIKLHAEKRDLADQILAGTGKAGQLSVDEIVGLITGG